MYPLVQAKLPFYALGQLDSSQFQARPFTRNSALPDSAANLIQRNQFSVSSVSYQEHLIKPKSDLSEMRNKSLNNYLQPLVSYNKGEK